MFRYRVNCKECQRLRKLWTIIFEWYNALINQRYYYRLLTIYTDYYYYYYYYIVRRISFQPIRVFTNREDGWSPPPSRSTRIRIDYVEIFWKISGNTSFFFTRTDSTDASRLLLPRWITSQNFSTTEPLFLRLLSFKNIIAHTVCHYRHCLSTISRTVLTKSDSSPAGISPDQQSAS